MNYTEIIESKNGEKIPLVNKTALHSKYNPEREAESFANQFASPAFFVVVGLAGGYHISALMKKFPESNVIAAENDESDLRFLEKLPEIQKLHSEKRFQAATKSDIKRKIIETYKPAIHGDMTIATLRSWENIFPDEKKEIIKEIQSALKIVSADYSVQCHFGKIWHKNIFENLKVASEIKTDIKKTIGEIPNEKIAAIIAAGPSLNETYKKIEDEREKYFVIATDTAFSVLAERKIKADCVVSVDGQNISHSHYMHGIYSDTIFVFDLCANSSAVRKVRSGSKKIIFTENGHPLAKYASAYTGKNSFLENYTGSGTVTIAAASFAITAGFTKIEFFGADFSYIGGAPYARGTYLDTIYGTSESKFENSETKFSALMFRTELKRVGERKFTTEVLESYENSAEKFMSECGFSKTNEGKTKFFKSNGKKDSDLDFVPFSYEDFRNFYKNRIKNIPSEDSAEMTTMLPLVASLKSRILAHSKSLEYTDKL